MKEEDILKILVATDIHLGYKEKDSSQEKDSFNSFEEVFLIAKEKNADFVLLGGDLFHENKPSRKSLHSCMEIMRKYCLGSRPCQVEILSDQSIDFGHTSRTVTSANYEDPNLNIEMPVFSIHGNHDDPAGSGGLSAIDLLSVAGLLNHFGRATSLESIDISPVLLRKGSTKLALYGLGSVRDERLHRLFLKKNVKFLRPKENTDEWYNIMVIHQNRAKHGPTNHIPEQFLDSFLDLVIWGHEHECMKEVEWNSVQNFFVLQPGSTVATSLSAGESRKKHVTFLQIHGKEMKHEFIPLQTVRSMYVEDIILKDLSCISAPSVPTVEDEIQAYCRERVETLIMRAEEEHSGHPKQPKLPLIRLRIDYSGDYPTFNSYRLGANFTESVANPDSIIHFLKKSVKSMKEVKQDLTDLDNLIVPEVVEKVKVEDLVEDYLSSKDKKYQMSLLSARGMSLAVREYVEKKEKDAIYDLCDHQLKKVTDHLKMHKPTPVERDDIIEEIQRFKEEKKAANASAPGGTPTAEFENEEDFRAILARVKQERSVLGVATPTVVDSDSEVVISDGEQEGPTTSKRGRGGTRGSRGGTRGRGRGKGSRGGRVSKKPAIPVVETPPQRNIMDAFGGASQSSRARTQNKRDVTEISDSDDEDVQITSRAPPPKTSTRRPTSKRGRGVNFDSDDDNPFGPASSRKKKR